jgi:L-fuconolactonase
MTDRKTRIDAHHHFWRYDPLEYEWISNEMSAIQHDFLPADLKQQIEATGIDGVIPVQARQTVEETRWLLSFASQADFIRGVVGWAPLTTYELEETLAEMAQNPKLRGVRHVLQGEPDELYMLRGDFNRGVRLLKHFKLTYDILIYERQLPQTIEFVDFHPNQVFVVDHLAKPRVRENELSPWRENIRELARRANVYCKISGLATEADHHAWTIPQLLPYIETVLEAFGPKRCMFGSDWPVCLVAIPYQEWVDLVNAVVDNFSETEQAQFWSGTAQEAYALPDASL